MLWGTHKRNCTSQGTRNTISNPFENSLRNTNFVLHKPKQSQDDHRHRMVGIKSSSQSKEITLPKNKIKPSRPALEFTKDEPT